MLNLYNKPFASRLLIGSALYPSPKIMQDADPRVRRADRHGVAAARIRRRQDRRCVLVADPRARCHGAAEHRRLPQRARGGDHRQTGARTVRHLLDQARGDRRQRHAAARRGRPGRSRRHPDQGRLRGVSLLHRRPQRRDAAGRCRLQGGDAVGGADRQRQGHHQPRCAETAARPAARHHAGGRCRPRRAEPRGRSARTRLRRRAAQHRDRQSRRSRRDGGRIQARGRGRPHRLSRRA